MKAWKIWFLSTFFAAAIGGGIANYIVHGNLNNPLITLIIAFLGGIGAAYTGPRFVNYFKQPKQLNEESED